MAEQAFSYLGKFEFEEGANPGLNILVIREHGAVRLVGEGVDQTSSADTPAEWEAQLLTLLPELGIQTDDFHYVEPFR
jgi:hypothetical protein